MYRQFKAILGRIRRAFQAKRGRQKAVSSADALAISAPPQWLEGVLFGEIELFLSAQRAPLTAKAYRQDLKQFVGYLRAQRAVMGLEFILRYREWLITSREEGGAGLSHVAANRKFAALRTFFTWLEQRGKIAENPLSLVKNFRARKESSTQDFTDAEVDRMLVLPSIRSRSGRMHQLILGFLFYLGLRRSELVQLKASHLLIVRNGQDNSLVLKVPGKGDKERLIPIPARLELSLRHYLDKEAIVLGEDKFLFRAVRNNVSKNKQSPLSSHAIYYIVKKYARLAGVERRVSPHSCRATCISHALDQGATHRAVQELAGWSSPLMLERYDKRRTSLRNSAVHLIDYQPASPVATT